MGKAEVERFLRKKNFLASEFLIEDELKVFLADMQEGLKNQRVSQGMMMLPTYLTLGEDITKNEPVIVMDAGGTNFRICLIEFTQDGSVKVSMVSKLPMPGVETEVSADEFYNFIVDQLEAYLEYSQKISFCFSYPCEIQSDHDGIALRLNKEVKISGIKGTYVGREIKARLQNRGHDVSKISFVILNDTVASLLGGFYQGRNLKCSSYASMVLGTGINTAYVEANSNITKLSGAKNSIVVDQADKMIINMESGNYRVSKLSDIDAIVDSKSVVAGEQMMEKKISGRYQGAQIYYSLREACQEEELFSEQFKANFAKVEELESSEVTGFLADPYGQGILSQCCYDDYDRENIYYIIDNMLEIAAKLVTTMIAAIHLQTGAGQNPVKPLAITVEGTTYYKSPVLRAKISRYIQEFINGELGYYNVLMQAEEANVVGSALAILMNE